jgi:hypothetical protein
MEPRSCPSIEKKMRPRSIFFSSPSGIQMKFVFTFSASLCFSFSKFHKTRYGKKCIFGGTFFWSKLRLSNGELPKVTTSLRSMQTRTTNLWKSDHSYCRIPLWIKYVLHNKAIHK